MTTDDKRHVMTIAELCNAIATFHYQTTRIRYLNKEASKLTKKTGLSSEYHHHKNCLKCNIIIFMLELT